MPTLINDPWVEERLLADRRERGIDGHDEVWDGVYVIVPPTDNEHQDIQANLITILAITTDWQNSGQIFAGANVSDHPHDWTQNYRVPDVLVFSNGNPAEDRDTHWFGGPDFAVEIVSRWDRSREKIDFYSRIGVRELLIIDRDPWQLELFRLIDDRLQSIAVATVANALVAKSEVVPITLQLTAGAKRPLIAVTSRDGQAWEI